MSYPKPPLKPSPPQPRQVQPHEPEEEEGGGKMLPLLLAFVCIAAIVYIWLARGQSDGPCHDAVPSERTGRCPDTRQRVTVFDGVALCQCPPEAP